VGRLLQTLDYALRVNAKKIEASSAHPDRAAQFDYIAAQRQAFTRAGWPIVSVDTKKKELIGNFKNAGRAWSLEAEAVNVHDFRQQALGRAAPYGIYDVTHNRGTVYVGSSGDTAAFAVDALVHWWQAQGYPSFRANQLLIVADGGGSNGCRLWKPQLQEHLCDGLGLTVTVCHYPTGCSKWNPIEHRLFAPISLTWAGYPLRTWETMLTYLRLIPGSLINEGCESPLRARADKCTAHLSPRRLAIQRSRNGPATKGTSAKPAERRSLIVRSWNATTSSSAR